MKRRPCGSDLESVRAAVAAPPRRVLSSRADSVAGSGTPPRALRLDSHYHRELHLVIAGERLFAVGGRVFRVRPGDAVFVDRWEEHASWPEPGADEPEPFVCAVLHGHDPAWWNAAAEGRAGVGHRAVEGTFAALSDERTATFRRRVEAALGRAEPRAAAAGLAAAAAAAVAEYARALDRAAAGRRGAPPALEAVRRRIERTRGAGCTVKGLAALAGLAPRTLRRRFRAAFGTGVRDEIRRVRADYARFAAVLGEPPKAIASALGLANASRFGRRCGAPRSRSSRIEDIVRTYVAHRHGADCSLAELAARFGYSESRLAHLYRERTGETIGAAVRRERAAFVRSHPGLTAAALARELGFRSEEGARRFAAAVRRSDAK